MGADGVFFCGRLPVTRLLSFTLLLAVCACKTNDKPPPDPVPPLPGAVVASFDPECFISLACVCTIPKAIRPKTVPLPKKFQRAYPHLPKEIPNGCRDNA